MPTQINQTAHKQNNREFLDIDRIAFIGRTYSEYVRMFDLNASILKKGRVLDCPSGPSSFAAEARRLGFNVAGCDLLYDLPPERLLKKGKEDIELVFQKIDEVAHLYVWKYYKNRDEIIGLRHKALQIFIDDYSDSERNQYFYGKLPRLPFPDKTFSLVLVSHFLFLYGDRLSLDFHTSCFKELVRVCSGEVRVFPLQGLDAKPYPYLAEVMSFLRSEQVDVEILEVPFEFQRGSNRMMRLKRK